MTNTPKDPAIPCPECDTPIDLLSDFKIGSIVECPACGVDCEVVNLSPLTLAPLEEEK